ncbi:MAG: Hsp20/alpha crystallin family protein [Bacteroidales bacterium]|nr:Hsp20/alpha crystallin family protein [Bacteroidales bacterium]MDD3299363.1 Hsp20/alpha crystallin family protein [Bacteroidales bacterium]MDD3843815.1 Hsp20/alpha crystallin family protein [Bacteroidales bacterium]MDD4618255.1 Hsp20/alpha crystallin family protein [Bacteroidales bacterium]
MTLIRRNETFPMWANIFNDIFNHDWNDMLLRNYSQTNTTLPSVNVKENPDEYEVEMAAPGMDKGDFKVEVNQGILTISSEKKIENEDQDKGNYTRREFSYQSFCRSFSLPISVDSEKIYAKYENGLLKVVIPKREEAKPKPIRMIDIE